MMKTKILTILLCLALSFGAVYAYGYDSDSAYRQAERDSQIADIQHQMDMIQVEREQQRVQDQVDKLIDDCNREYWD